ncbi:MAG: type II toxin-antitoxin system HicB family antitoxin [Candidatus Altiarchaeota archaeon]|nr:type II toxin-antitoxin system HicB family antitoxin [Candidatus Altiarchaeota archaeon]
MDLTAIIKRGEKQYVALCPEIDVVSQGYSIEEALKNLKEAVNLYLEEFEIPEEVKSKETLIARFEVKDVKTPNPIGTSAC